MSLQRADGSLPGADDVLEGASPTSIGGIINEFLNEYVVNLPITSRRAYERSLVLLLRDLSESGPEPSRPAESLTGDRFSQHLHWRVNSGLDEPAELTRCAVQLGHLTEWLADRGVTGLDVDRDALRATAASLALVVE
jgi:hypothetical protein